jgi:hypothetical protein
MSPASDPESRRLAEHRDKKADWHAWGPYLSERAWGTVREDYTADGSAWAHLTHDAARSKAYRWGEDGLAGVCDRYQILCFALAVWNGRDPILKERAFGVVPGEGNHGEDLKEYYFYVDSTPTHSYMRYLYKYPQAEFPYQRLVDENRARNGSGPEFELLDTGVFAESRYFDVVVEYAKADPDDLCVRIEVFNRGPEEASIQLLPHLWFRNIWSWSVPRGTEPVLERGPVTTDAVCVRADDTHATGLTNLPTKYRVGERLLYADRDGQPLFTDNETDAQALYGVPDGRRHVKNAFHRYVVGGDQDAVNPAERGTKACIRYERRVPAGRSTVLRLRLRPQAVASPLAGVDAIVAARRAEADAFYAGIHPAKASADEKLVQRQAFAGLMWGKQNYIFDVDQWLRGDPAHPPPPKERTEIRNKHWRHLNSMRVLSMPDTWEYPWFAAWDLAFHAVAIARIDGEFAKGQLWLMLFEQFQHPNGQIPAYEWEFSDLNPPVHAWAVWRVYNMDRVSAGRADRAFLEKCFHKLLINFAWWINKVDSSGNNVFEGGFLGLDNITVFDRSTKLPGGAVLEQSDATGWMGMFCLNMMRIALELAKDNRTYEGLATKFFQHYVYVGAAMKNMGGRNYNLWDEKDGFFYDVLRYPDGRFQKLRVRSLVGLIPLYAVERLETSWIEQFPEFKQSLNWFLENRKDIAQHCVNRTVNGGVETLALTIVDQGQLKRMLQRICDPDEFLSDYGMRSLSKFHEHNPFVLGEARVSYEPAEALSKIKGGNSNWRGPIWFPTSFLMIESLRKLSKAYGEGFTVEAKDGRVWTLGALANTLADRMIAIFARDAKTGRRPVYGALEPFGSDPHWKDLVSFHEYFHGDNGFGLGAAHQTGWTGLAASLIDEWRR